MFFSYIDFTSVTCSIALLTLLSSHTNKIHRKTAANQISQLELTLQEAYIVPATPKPEPVKREDLPKPIVFHDGRLAHKPTPLLALLTVLWIPIGFLLACLRIAAGALLPMKYVYYAFTALGVRVIIKGTPPPPAEKSTGQSGVLFICSHRTLLDPIFLSTALGRPIAAVTYSVSRLSEIISPIKTVRLSRDRAKDAAMIKNLLQEGDLVICPEGKLHVNNLNVSIFF